MSDPVTAVKNILVCVGPGPSSAGVIRAAWEKARDMEAKLLAVHVESPRTLLRDSDRERILDDLRFAEKLGAETFTLAGRNIAETVIGFARERNVARIVVGRPRQSLLRRLSIGSPVDALIRKSEGIDVEVVSGAPGEKVKIDRVQPPGVNWPDYGTAILFQILATVLCFLVFPYLAPANLIMIYLMAVMLTAIDCGRGPAMMASALSVLAFDFFFVPPRYTFTVNDAQYIVTFIVMFAVALAISHLTSVMRKQTEIARMEERQVSAMYGLSSQLASSRNPEDTLKIGVEYISMMFDSHSVVLLPDIKGKLTVAAGDPSSVFLQDFTMEMRLAGKTFETGTPTCFDGDMGRKSKVIYVPLRVADTRLGVFALRPEDPERLDVSDRRFLLESLVRQVALSLEMEYLSEKGTVIHRDFSRLKGPKIRPDSPLES